MVFNDDEAEEIRSGSLQIKTDLPEQKPAFMQYMEGLNVNVVDKAYIDSHFEEEEAESKAEKSPPKKEI